MKVVILAAGKGSRLGKQAGPKPLTLLENGKSILQLQIETLTQYLSIHDLLVVVGYCKEMIMDQFPNLLYVYNPDFAQENTSKSLLKALYKIDDDVLWINGDVIFHPSSLEKILKSPNSCMLVNQGAVGEEEVKYRTDGHQRILEVSKQVKHPEGEALGLNLCKQKELASLKKHLSACQNQDYFEKAIEGMLSEGIVIQAMPIDRNLCVEIDFYEDILHANTLIREWF